MSANLSFRDFALFSLEQHSSVFLVFQIPCADLHEVIDALVEKTAGTLQPFLLEEPYEENISKTQPRHKYISKDVYCPPVYFVLRQRKFSVCAASLRFS